MNPPKSSVPKPVVLVVLDGFGVSLETRGNAIAAAETPTLKAIEAAYPFTALQAAGIAVGLPWGEPGNSEVGHLTMGAGRAIYHHLPRIIHSIRDGSFFENPAFAHAAEHVRHHRSALHLVGLFSSGSVHSYSDHLWALLDFAKGQGVPTVFVHTITDGKDAPPQEAAGFMARLQERIGREYPFAAVASAIGRFYAMDRDEQWSRIERAFRLLVEGSGAASRDLVASLRSAYARGLSDDDIEPTIAVGPSGEHLGRFGPGDAVILFNFREDSMRELVESLVREPFDGFPRELPPDLKIVTMTEYAPHLPGVEAAFPPLEISWPLSRVLSAAGKRQLKIAETEKYAHVTYFFNGGIEKPFPAEDRILEPSITGSRFEAEPEMRSGEITAKVIGGLDGYDFILANYANADMVGHTGNFAATIEAVEALDRALGAILPEVTERGGALIVTGDHGNAEQKIHPISGEPLTEHTVNPVPFYLIAERFRRGTPRNREEILVKKKETGGLLSDIAPTIIELLRLSQPPEMTGKSLLPMLVGAVEAHSEERR